MPTILVLASAALYRLLENFESGFAKVPLAPLLNVHFDIVLPGSQPLIRRGRQRQAEGIALASFNVEEHRLRTR